MGVFGGAKDYVVRLRNDIKWMLLSTYEGPCMMTFMLE
jgi:hypothetical protein